ncbi:MAG TPA: hypothetical protein VIS27_09570 [Yeosuana sp.]
MIDKIKDILIILGAGALAILAYILSQKDKKIGELYYQAKSEAYKSKLDQIEVKHGETVKEAIISNTKYRDLKRKYDEAKSRTTTM